MMPKVSAFIHHPSTGISTVLTLDERLLIVLSYKPFMELINSESYYCVEVESLIVKRIYPNTVAWRLEVYFVLGMLCLPLIQIPQVWIATTILSWFLLGKKALGGQEWGLVLRVTKLDPTGQKSSFLRQICSSPIKEDIESAKQVISSAVGKSLELGART